MSSTRGQITFSVKDEALQLNFRPARTRTHGYTEWYSDSSFSYESCISHKIAIVKYLNKHIKLLNAKWMKRCSHIITTQQQQSWISQAFSLQPCSRRCSSRYLQQRHIFVSCRTYDGHGEEHNWHRGQTISAVRHQVNQVPPPPDWQLTVLDQSKISPDPDAI